MRPEGLLFRLIVACAIAKMSPYKKYAFTLNKKSMSFESGGLRPEEGASGRLGAVGGGVRKRR